MIDVPLIKKGGKYLIKNTLFEHHTPRSLT